jgi:hypothetical protein
MHFQDGCVTKFEHYTSLKVEGLENLKSISRFKQY